MIYGNKMTMLNALCIVGLSGCVMFSSAMDKPNKLVVASKSDGVVKRSDNLFTPTAVDRLEKAQAANQANLTHLDDVVKKRQRPQQTNLHPVPFNNTDSGPKFVVTCPSDDETSDESYESAPKKRKLTQQQLNNRKQTRVLNAAKKEEEKTLRLTERRDDLFSVIAAVDAGQEEDFFGVEIIKPKKTGSTNFRITAQHRREEAKREKEKARAARREQMRKEQLAAEQLRKASKKDESSAPVTTQNMFSFEQPTFSFDQVTDMDIVSSPASKLKKPVLSAEDTSKNTRSKKRWTMDAQSTLEAGKGQPQVKADGRSGVPQRLEYMVDKRQQEKDSNKQNDQEKD